MQKGFLKTTLGGRQIEHIPCPHPSIPVDLEAPAVGVLHTVEGSLGSQPQRLSESRRSALHAGRHPHHPTRPARHDRPFAQEPGRRRRDEPRRSRRRSRSPASKSKTSSTTRTSRRRRRSPISSQRSSARPRSRCRDRSRRRCRRSRGRPRNSNAAPPASGARRPAGSVTSRYPRTITGTRVRSSGGSSWPSRPKSVVKPARNAPCRQPVDRASRTRPRRFPSGSGRGSGGDLGRASSRSSGRTT